MEGVAKVASDEAAGGEAAGGVAKVASYTRNGISMLRILGSSSSSEPDAAAAVPDMQEEGPCIEERVARIKDLICEVYKEHNPEKLNDIDWLLEKYKGHEYLVYLGICDKYKVESG